MTRVLWRLILLAAVVFVAIWLWRHFFPGPEQAIRKNLAELAQAACVTPNEAPVTKLSNTLKIASLFAEDAELTLDVPGQLKQTISGRENIRTAVAGARSMVTSLKVEFLDVDVNLSSDKRSAAVRLTAKGDIPGETTPQVQELKADLKYIDGHWLIYHAETVKTLH
jgi:hypothetical protein